MWNAHLEWVDVSVSPELPVRVQEPLRSEELWPGPGERVHVGRPLERNHHCPGGDDPVPEPYWRQDPVGDALNDNLGKFIEKTLLSHTWGVTGLIRCTSMTVALSRFSLCSSPPSAS